MNPLSMITTQTDPVLKQAESSYYGKLRMPRVDDTPLQDIDPAKVKNYDQIVAKAQEFESVFISEMLKPMFESVEVDPLFGGGNSEEIFRGMLVQEYGKKIAEAKGIGIADFVKRELIRIQQEAQNGR